MEIGTSLTRQGADCIDEIVKKTVDIDGPGGFGNLGKKPVTVPDCGWEEKENMIYFPITFDGTKGSDWPARLESKNIRLGFWAKKVLNSNGFKTSPKGTVTIAVIKGKMLKDKKRFIKNIFFEAERRKFKTPFPDITCFIREFFSDELLEQMSFLDIIGMHQPVMIDSYPHNLSASRGPDCSRLDAYSINPEIQWKNMETGFAFLA